MAAKREPSLQKKKAQTEGKAYTFSGEAIDPNRIVPGGWGEKFQTNRGYTYPFELDSPLLNCSGFTLDYVVFDVLDNNISDSTQFKVFVRTVKGDWIGVKLFTLTNGSAFINVKFDRFMDVAAVAVMCQQGASYEYDFQILDAN